MTEAIAGFKRAATHHGWRVGGLLCLEATVDTSPPGPCRDRWNALVRVHVGIGRLCIPPLFDGRASQSNQLGPAMRWLSPGRSAVLMYFTIEILYLR